MSRKILFFGSAWGKVLAHLLKNPQISTEYISPSFRLDILFWAVLKSDVIVRVGMPPGLAGFKNRLFDIFWIGLRIVFGGKNFYYYWIGSDVLLAANIDNLFIKKLIFNIEKRAKHLANAPWLKTELLELGVDSVLALFPGTNVDIPMDEKLNWPKNFTVATYIPDHRHDFYGGNEVIRSAKEMPDCKFIIFGGKGKWLREIPSNVEFLGFVDNINDLYNNINVLIRFVKHDAIGGTVREALFYGRHVIYSYNLSGVSYVPYGNVNLLLLTLRELHKKHLEGRLGINWDGRAVGVKMFEPKNLISSFLANLQE
jgi:hypothetical protein